MSFREEEKDGHEHDVLMPGFRFHPTDEELVEFYLRRKVEGKRFNVELIAFLDIYRHDPWELPALATVGEKEWFFYVPRDKKYRNGDRPNRVTKSGYWKATGADRLIRTEGAESIGLKKTLVFYTGKAPKGTRTRWIMIEYRLPQNEFIWYHKVEISLCRIYKRVCILESHIQLPAAPSTQPSSSRGTKSDKNHNNPHQQSPSCQTLAGDSSTMEMEKSQEAGASINTGVMTVSPMASSNSTSMEEDYGTPLECPKNANLLHSSSYSFMPAATIDELNMLVGYHQSYVHQSNHFISPVQSTAPLTADKLWEWNHFPETSRDHTSFQ